MENQEVREFVRDLCLKGRTDRQIRAVARATRWRNDIERIENLLSSVAERWRKSAKKSAVSAAKPR